MEASTLLPFPGMSIFIVTKLQLEFHVDLKNFFCAIGGFKDLAALSLGQILMRVLMLSSRVLYSPLQGYYKQGSPAPGWSENRVSLFPAFVICSKGKLRVKEETLFPLRTPCISPFPVFSQPSSPFHVAGAALPLRFPLPSECGSSSSSGQG